MRSLLKSLALLCILLATGSLASTIRRAPANLRAPATTRIEYDGTVYFEAHFRHPGDVHPYHSRSVYSMDGAGNARLDWTTWQDGDSVPAPESFLIARGHTLHRDSPADAWRESSGRRLRQSRLQAIAGLPEALEAVTRAQPDHFGVWQGGPGRITRYTYLQAHARLGDVRDSVAYVYGKTARVPDSLSMTLIERDHNWRLTAHRSAWSHEALPDSVFALPDSITPAPPNEEDDKLGAVPPFTSVAEGIWSLDLDDIDSRTVFVEFADHLAVLEIAVGSANGERIVDAARTQWPNKPIRYAMFSHYHPHYTGGLRAMIAAGATVVTTPGNEAFVRRIAALPFKTVPDRLARHRVAVNVTTFADSVVLEDVSNRLVAYNYGDRSLHTDEFVVFWLPRQQLLFESEQGWQGASGQVRAGRRARGLLSWIDEKHLDVQRLLQGWPERGQAATVTRAELDSIAPKPR